jgi:hypothetical protein
VRMNAMLGGILDFKLAAEDALRASGVGYRVVGCRQQYGVVRQQLWRARRCCLPLSVLSPGGEAYPCGGARHSWAPKPVYPSPACGCLSHCFVRGGGRAPRAGVPAAIVRPCALTEEPRGMPLVIDQGDVIKARAQCLHTQHCKSALRSCALASRLR